MSCNYCIRHAAVIVRKLKAATKCLSFILSFILIINVSREMVVKLFMSITPWTRCTVSLKTVDVDCFIYTLIVLFFVDFTHVSDHGKKTPQHEETQPLLDSSATLPSPQRLHGMDQSHPNIEPENPANKPKEEHVTETPAEQKLPDSDSCGKNEPDSDGGVKDFTEDNQSDPQVSNSPEQPGMETPLSAPQYIKHFHMEKQ